MLQLWHIIKRSINLCISELYVSEYYLIFNAELYTIYIKLTLLTKLFLNLQLPTKGYINVLFESLQLLSLYITDLWQNCGEYCDTYIVFTFWFCEHEIKNFVHVSHFHSCSIQKECTPNCFKWIRPCSSPSQFFWLEFIKHTLQRSKKFHTHELYETYKTRIFITGISKSMQTIKHLYCTQAQRIHKNSIL